MSQAVTASSTRRFGLRLVFLWDLVLVGFLVRTMKLSVGLWSDIAREEVGAIGPVWPGLAVAGVFFAALVFARHHKRKSAGGVSGTIPGLLIAAVALVVMIAKGASGIAEVRHYLVIPTAVLLVHVVFLLVGIAAMLARGNRRADRAPGLGEALVFTSAVVAFVTFALYLGLHLT
jgi:hypothetical protein